MKIWIIDHYSVPEKYYPLIRNSNFARYLKAMGHEVMVISASSVHNSEINLITDKTEYREEETDDVHYVYVRCDGYSGNGVKRILNMEQFALRLPKVCNRLRKKYGTPDAIVACSMTLQACRAGIRLARKYGCKGIAQVTDLWPETLVEYGIAGKYNPAVIYLRMIEKWIYMHAEKIVFSLEGAYDYITEQGWQNRISREKVKYINNGVDLDKFVENRDKNVVDDVDLNDNNTFKVVYTGSIRQVNNLGRLLDIAKLVKNPSIRFLIWGDGDELEKLKARVLDEKIANVLFKGKVEKKYIPYVTTRADLNLSHGTQSNLFRFGISQNKMFDYFASGKPTVCDFPCKYNPIEEEKAGICVSDPGSEAVAEAIEQMASLSAEVYDTYCKNALAAAKKYDFKNLTKELLNIIEEA